MKRILVFTLVTLLAFSCKKEGTTPIIAPPSHSETTDDDPGTVPDKDGMNVKGRVTDKSTGKGIAGVVVSDGIQCTQTDAEGIYYFKSDMSKVRSVFVVTPSEYSIEFGNNTIFSGYRPVSSVSKVSECNFVLAPRTGSRDDYKVVFLGDPQVKSDRAHSAPSWKYVTDGLNEYRKTAGSDLYQILLGDMVTNEIEVNGKADSFISTLVGAHINSFCVAGNHDHIQSAVKYYDSVSKYFDYFGPYNFAVNIGKVHYIFFDSVNWHDKTFEQAVTADALSFMKEDLKYVVQDTPIVICTHCPLTRKNGGLYHSTSTMNYMSMMDLLKGRDVSFWYGHIHFNNFWSYNEAQILSKAPGVNSLESHVVGRCGGCWSCSGEVCRDGSPRGFVELTVKGKDMQWRYISLDSKYPDDFNVLLPGELKGEGLVDDSALYCNVYLWDEKWSAPELWVNGSKAGDFVRCVKGDYIAVADPWYSHFYPIWKAKKISGMSDDPPKEYDNSHLFSIVPPAGVKSAEIHVKDRWGNVYTRTVNL